MLLSLTPAVPCLQVYASHHPLGVIRSPQSPEETRGLTRSGDLSRMLPLEAHLLAAGWPRRQVGLFPTSAVVVYTLVQWLRGTVLWPLLPLEAHLLAPQASQERIKATGKGPKIE